MSDKYEAKGYLGRTPLGKLYRCWYSGQIAIARHMKFIASPLPQAPAPIAVHATLQQDLIKKKRKESLQAFAEMDRNCNTCKHFTRTHTSKKGTPSPAAFIYGHCHINQNIKVHAADWMGMECWEPRTQNN